MSARATDFVTVFAAEEKIAAGEIREVIHAIKDHLRQTPRARILIVSDVTGAPVDLDLRGTADTVIKKLEAETAELEEKKSGPGRPRLGVVAREVTLLPHQWDWLSSQPGGASVTLRKLVEDAKKKNFAKDQVRRAQEVTHKFMSTMAGDLAGYEEALRALYARDRKSFLSAMREWPVDIREHALKISKLVWE